MSTEDDAPSALTYAISSDDGKNHTYHFDMKDARLALRETGYEDCAWARLEYHQCPNCPLTAEDTTFCPIASPLSGLLKDWNNSISYVPVKISVKTNQRTVIGETTAQNALGSLIGLIMATSDCPHTQFFRPMAQFHLPLASNEETSFRAISTYLLTQYFRKLDGQEADLSLDGLSEIYENMHDINVHIKRRLLEAVEEDAALNAVVVLDIFTITSTNYLTEELDTLKQLFSILNK